MSGAATATLSLHPDHLADLRKSGLTDDTIRAAGVYSVRPCDLSRIIGFAPQGVTSALAFPYLGDGGFIRVKVFPSYRDKGGHTVRYLQRKGTGARLYIPQGCEAVLGDTSIPLAVTEGEKKALKLTQEGTRTLGIGGLWNWIKQGEPIPDLDKVTWSGRRVVLYPDSDVWERSDLLQAVYALAKELEARGATVLIAVISHGVEKIGVDDYLQAGGTLASLVTIPLTDPCFASAARWWEEWRQRADREGHTGGGQPGEGRKSLSDALVDFKDLLAIQLPERRRYIPWLAAGSNVMVFGPRGVGKTYFNLGLATALTTAAPFLRSQVTDPIGVLYVDGEMQLDELRARAAALLPEPPQAPLLFLTSELVYHRTQRDLVLTSEPARAEITAMLDRHPTIKVVILDNVSTLFSGIDEDSKHHWEPIGAWLIKLRHRGLATVLAHHTGNSGRQRGTSGREDSLDAVISLTFPAGYDAREGCHFELRFTKSRSVKGDDVAPLDVKLTEQDGRLTWAWSSLEDSKLDRVKALLADGVTSVSDIAEELGISKGYASKLVKNARGKP